jgi:predicted HicB family RNase H-like nuclease
MQKEFDNSIATSRAGKTHSVTFRLDSKVIEEVQLEADNKEISLNVLVNQAPAKI